MKNYFESIKNKNIHIVGLSGAEGSAVAFFLAEGGVKKITAHDFSENPEEFRKNFWKTHLNLPPLRREEEFKKMMNLPIKINYRNEYLDGVLEADIIFVPSSWFLYKFNFPKLKEAEEKGIAFSSITNLYFDLAPCPIISVTGTKGKGTTSKLIYEILKLDKEKKKTGKVYLGGNDRTAGQALQDLMKMTKDDVLVLETSNRQLIIDLKKSPRIGVITNITPDHIEEHGGFEGYVKAKRKLIKYQKKGDYAVLNYDNEITRKFANEFPETSFLFSGKVPLSRGAYIKNKSIFARQAKTEEKICGLSDVKIIGSHNIENVLAAVSAAYLFGASPENIKEAIINFKGLRHRIEFIGEFEGIKFYDDLASTTPESTIAAINALKEGLQIVKSKLILIAGGDSKGGEYDELADIISKKVDVLILLPGTGSIEIKNQISKIKDTVADVLECDDFSGALKILKAQTKTGDIILISPACAYFQSKYIDGTNKNLRKLIKENFTEIGKN